MWCHALNQILRCEYNANRQAKQSSKLGRAEASKTETLHFNSTTNRIKKKQKSQTQVSGTEREA